MRTLAVRCSFFLVLCFTGFLASCGDSGPRHDEHAASHAVDGEFERGPHRGRMLRQDGFAMEVTIFETGVPPQFRLYAYVNDAPVPPADVDASITLGRLGGGEDAFSFVPEGDFLVGSATVVEPHSFDVTVSATHAGRTYRWSYESYEGRTTIPATAAAAAGLTTERAGSAMLHQSLSLLGRVAINADRHAAIKARFPGPVRAVRVNLGDSVRVGQSLALVENSETLGTYAVLSPIDGVVLARHTNVGDVAGSEALFEIADLSVLWVEAHAFGKGAVDLRPGLPMRIVGTGEEPITTTVERVLPLASSATQSVVVRALLPNPDGRWRPGMAVSADVTVSSREVPVAVKLPALQRFRDFTVVFAKVGDTYEVRMLELGERDHEQVEVLEGLSAGTEYVVEQSFLIKADIEKSGASHDH